MITTRKLIGAAATLTMVGIAGCTTPAPGPADPTTTTASTPTQGAPQAGGEIVYGIPGEPAGFNVTAQACPQPCQLVAMTIYDPLLALDEELNPVPYLASSVEPNDDYTHWTVNLRSGVTFHDGTPFTADVVRQNFEAAMTPPALAADALNAQIESLEVVDDLTITFTMDGARPSFPLVLASSTGLMVAPATIASGVDGGLEPIGTGPYVFQEWQQGDHITVTRNEAYWQDGLPYLDRVVFRPIEDAAARTAAFERGELDVIMTDVPEQIARIEAMAGIWLNKSTEAASTDEWVLNNETGPTSDIRVRQALVHALDRQTYAEVLGAGVVVPANGPFPTGTIGYLEDPGGAGFDLERARELVAEYEAENGPLKLTVQAGQDKATAAQLAQSMWQEAGIDIEIQLGEGNVVLTNLLLGNYEILAGALPGNVNPAEHAIWWSSTNINPVGEVSTNYARINDPQIDQALDLLAASSDPDKRRAAAEAINRRFAEESYAVWTYWTVWATASTEDLHDFVGIQLPDGQTSNNTNQGLHFLTRAWKA